MIQQNQSNQKQSSGFPRGQTKKFAQGKLSYNFSAGPCILPRVVLDQCTEDMIDYQGTGQSILELSHRMPEFVSIAENCREEIRTYLQVPDDFVIQLNQGGASNQYTCIVKNLIGYKPQRKAMYLTTGHWSNQCLLEAKKYIEPEKLIEVASGKQNGFKDVPDPSIWKIDPQASYFHVCWNETVDGIEFSNNNFPWDLIPTDVPIVADMSSNIGTEKVNWDRISVAYMGAQKNLGPAGCTVVIIKKSLLGYSDKDIPVMCDWLKNENSPNGYYNTPPTFSIYATDLNVSYMNHTGGVEHYEKLAYQRSEMLYTTINNSCGYYICKTQKKHRSRINAIFRIKNPALESLFIKQAAKEGIINIKGHGTNPGIRISMYNAMPIEGVVALTQFMVKFRRENPVAANACM